MSYDPLEGYFSQPICEKCKKLIADGEVVKMVLTTEVNHIPSLAEEGDGEWFTNFDYWESKLYHEACL